MSFSSLKALHYISSLCLIVSMAVPATLAASSISKSKSTSPSREVSPQSSSLDFVRKLGKEAIDALTKKSLSDQERRARFIVLFNKYFAGDQIGKFVLGRYWKRASADQQATYLKLFVRSVANTYAVRFSEYKPEDSFEVLKDMEQPDKSIKVKSVLKRPVGNPISFVWVLYREGDSFKIYDVIIEGVSMSISQRSEYSSLIQRNGGSIQAFLDELAKSTPS